MFDLFDSISRMIYILKDAVILAKERTPTQRDRLAESIFDWYISEEIEDDILMATRSNSDIKVVAKKAHVLADLFLEGKEQYEKDRKNKA